MWDCWRELIDEACRVSWRSASPEEKLGVEHDFGRLVRKYEGEDGAEEERPVRLLFLRTPDQSRVLTPT